MNCSVQGCSKSEWAAGYCGPHYQRNRRYGNPLGSKENPQIKKAKARREVIVAMWHDGLALREIADCFGWSIGHIANEMFRMREEGYDLPYRYNRTPITRVNG